MTITIAQINAELTELRLARQKAETEVDNIQACMNVLMQKRNEMKEEIEKKYRSNLFNEMFS